MLSAPMPDTLVAMFKIPIPVDEEQRLEDFHQLDILLTKPEAVFDRAVHMIDAPPVAFDLLRWQ